MRFFMVLLCLSFASIVTELSGTNTQRGDKLHSLNSSSDFPETLQSNASNETVASTRIVGGYTVDVSNRQWMVGITFIDYSSSTNYICGGVYIGSYNNWHYMLTAAQCLVSSFSIAGAFFYTNSMESVSSGYYMLNQYGSKVYHPDYNATSHTNDIGILTFFHSSFSGPTPAALATPELNLVENETVTVTGYGFTSYANQSSDGVLRELETSIMSNSSCTSTFDSAGVSTNLDLQVCTYTNGEGACLEDSGGPLIVSRDSEEFVVGIVSWSIECADTANYPYVHTRISAYTEWIKTTVASLTGTTSDFLLFYQTPTAAPTSAPTEPTSAPTEPTSAPTEPTSAPTEPTSAPTMPTSAPIAPTIAPIAPTTAPIAPTTAPIAPTTAPIAPTTAPIAPTTAPVAPTTAPIAPTTAPIAPTTAPIAPTTAPIAPTTAPIAPTTAPIAPTSAPTAYLDVPTTSPLPLTSTETPNVVTETSNAPSITSITDAPIGHASPTVAPTSTPTQSPLVLDFPFARNSANRKSESNLILLAISILKLILM